MMIHITQKKNQFAIQLKNKKMINQHDLFILENRRTLGLYTIKRQKGIFSTQILYQTLSYEPLSNYLQKPYDEEMFKSMIHMIIHTFSEIERNYLSIEQLLLSADSIYVDPLTNQFYFAYIPHLDYIQETSIQEFFLELVRYCHFLTNSSYFIDEYLRIIHQSTHFSYHDLEAFVQAIPQKEEAYMPTQILNSSQETMDLNPPVIPYLLRKSTQEKIIIDHSPFTIGSLPISSYCILDNPAISRKHIQIINEQESYFIEDLGSKNHTYMNNELLEKGKSYPLSNGKVILANEEFEFVYDSLSI